VNQKRYLLAGLLVLVAFAACSGPSIPSGNESVAYAVMWAGRAIAGAILTSAILRAFFNQ
jgi:uncharacterized membrane protein